MRHRVAGRKLSRHTQHREWMFRNMLVSLISHERIKTTLPKAKEFRSWADKTVSLGKKGDLHARRRAFDLLRDRDAVKKLFDEIAPRFKDRQGGYTRVYKMGRRLGDAAPMALIELTTYTLPKKEKKSTVSKAKDVLKKEISFIQKLGARFIFNTKMETKEQWQRLLDASDAVVVAAGAGREMSLGIPGETLKGVFPAGDLLKKISEGQKPKIGSEVIVVGGGNSAIDAARSALRLGAHVTLVYRRARSDMPANVEELAGALDEGISLVCMTQPVEILGDGNKDMPKAKALKVQRMKAGPVDSSGRPTPVPTDDFYEIPCDSIVVAIGEKVGLPGLDGVDVAMERDGRLKVDPYSLRSANTKIFACGDAVMGPATAAEAMGQARVVSEFLDENLMGQKRFQMLFRSFDYKMEVPIKLTRAKMTRAIFIPVDARKSNFMEISLGYTGEQARIEADRCLRCDVRERKRETYSAPLEE